MIGHIKTKLSVWLADWIIYFLTTRIRPTDKRNLWVDRLTLYVEGNE